MKSTYKYVILLRQITYNLKLKSRYLSTLKYYIVIFVQLEKINLQLYFDNLLDMNLFCSDFEIASGSLCIVSLSSADLVWILGICK